MILNDRPVPGDLITPCWHDLQVEDSTERRAIQLPLYLNMTIDKDNAPVMTGAGASWLKSGEVAVVLCVYDAAGPEVPKSRQVSVMYVIGEKAKGWTWMSSDIKIVSRHCDDET